MEIKETIKETNEFFVLMLKGIFIISPFFITAIGISYLVIEKSPWFNLLLIPYLYMIIFLLNKYLFTESQL